MAETKGLCIEVLVEEPSAEEALRHILPKLICGRSHYKIINLGSKSKLLRKLNQRLSAYRDRIKNGENLRVVVLVDGDDDDCQTLKKQLETTANQSGLYTKSSPDHYGQFVVLNRIVIKELESWFIGDSEALCKAFSSLPSISTKSGIFRSPDNDGSWEALHRFLKKYGIYKSSYPKIDAARRIAPHMNPDQNRSPSFNCFKTGLEAILSQ